MYRSITFLILAFLLTFSAEGQNYFWIAFTDKSGTAFSLDKPEDFLSERAIGRRERQGIPIDSLDLPVNQSYIDSVLTLDVELVHRSKWLNGITVKTDLSGLEQSIAGWSFVKETRLSKPKPVTKSVVFKMEEPDQTEVVPIDTSLYGESVHQVGMLNGQFLHQKNYKGQGMVIAVLDGGFFKADQLAAFDSLWADGRILGKRDFVDPNSDFFATHYHGMSVLSTMGGSIPGVLIGTAPGAAYWLLRSEDVSSEFPIEEDNWVAAAEFADSVGADVINSSLGYFTFDNSALDHSYTDMDGKTTRVTKGANVAASRGMLVFASAGNERNNSWFRIIAPSDGTGVIGVGAVDKNLNPASFTSAGPAFGGAVKPNVAAMGYQSIAQLSSGVVGKISGTSFSSPILAGMVTCLWQMFPNKKATDIKLAVEMSASKYNSPDSLVGYGIPDMKAAAELLGFQNVNDIRTGTQWTAWPNPFADQITIHSTAKVQGNWNAALYSPAGVLLKTWNDNTGETLILNDLPALTSGIYFLRIESDEKPESIKLSKIR